MTVPVFIRGSRTPYVIVADEPPGKRLRDDRGNVIWAPNNKLEARLDVRAPIIKHRPVRYDYLTGDDPFVAWLRHRCYIVVQVQEGHRLRFIADYELVTGRSFTGEEKNLSFTKSDKWSYSMHVVFPRPPYEIPLPNLARPYEFQNLVNHLVIFNNRYVWSLLAIGFKLGSNREEHHGTQTQ